jgi:crossover junction endodeoxyribonuclease RuvC
MRVLGIDPGSRITGFGVINLLSSGRLEYVASGCVRVPTGDLGERLRIIYEGVGEVVAQYRPGSVAVERVFLSRNADSALKLGQARASAILAAACAICHAHHLGAVRTGAVGLGRRRSSRRTSQGVQS